ncbi:MAG: hypothetical protein ABIG46_02925 [Candidatus Omnitrophota bacterium]|nr:hypothetical protein [Candidatus Omnitrophota bacterium]
MARDNYSYKKQQKELAKKKKKEEKKKRKLEKKAMESTPEFRQVPNDQGTLE